nr:potassium channel protein [Vallicoccus soli]
MSADPHLPQRIPRSLLPRRRRPAAGPGPVSLPRPETGPLAQVLKRMVVAAAVLAATVGIVYADRDGYRDGDEVGSLTLLDAAYYATVTLSTTGYGDITPVTDQARLVNVLVVTPLRVLFLIILVGTTLEALTERSREQWRVDRWRSALKDHTVVVGFGTKGRSAVRTLLGQDAPPTSIVVVDPSPEAVADANREGIAGVVGDATRSEVLARAEVGRARRIIVAAQRDDTAVLVTLTARALNPHAVIVSSVRESENAPLLQQSGASTVITSSDAAGRLLGVASTNPSLGEVLEDLLVPGSGLQLTERVLRTGEVGRSVKDLPDIVLAVVRNGKVRLYDDPACEQLRQDDRLVVLDTRGPHATSQDDLAR